VTSVRNTAERHIRNRALILMPCGSGSQPHQDAEVRFANPAKAMLVKHDFKRCDSPSLVPCRLPLS